MESLAKIVDFDDSSFDPYAQDADAFGGITDLHERLARLRQRGDVLEGDLLSLLGLVSDSNLSDQRHFTILGYDLVSKVDMDPETFSNDAYEMGLGRTFGRTLTVMNPPVHGRYRRIFQKAFLPNVVAKIGDAFVQPVVDGLIARFERDGEADLIEQFTLRYPFQVIYRQLALPEQDIRLFQKLAISQTLIVGDLLRYAIEASEKLGDYFAEMIEERRTNPGGDLVSDLLEVEVDGEKLPDELLIGFLRQLINAAGDTTYRSTGTLLMALLQNSEQFEAVKTDRSLVSAAIEETMRWDSPVAIHYRSAARDTILGGVSIPSGAVINVVLASANRDPAVFEQPERFDIFRPRPRHLGFGTGPHLCVGQHLARLEMTRAINSVLDRLPNLQLDERYPPPRVCGAMMRAVPQLHVTFDPAM